MKTQLIFLALIIPLIATAQKSIDTIKIPFKEGKIFYEKVVDIAGAKQGPLVKKAKIWFANTFNQSSKVVQGETENQILGKGNLIISKGILLPERTDFTILVECKDQKYRARIYDVSGAVLSGKPENNELFSYEKIYNDVYVDHKKFRVKYLISELRDFDKAIQKLFTSLEVTMKKNDDF